MEAPFDVPVIGARWLARQQMNILQRRGFPDAKFLDDQPYWEERRPWARGGTSAKHQREKELHRQREEERRREEAVCSSPASSPLVGYRNG